MFDRSSIKTTGKWQQDQTSPNNFIYMSTGIRVSPTTAMIPRETYNLFPPDDYVIKYDATGWSKAVGESTQIPLKYYDNNITGTLHLMEIMEKPWLGEQIL